MLGVAIMTEQWPHPGIPKAVTVQLKEHKRLLGYHRLLAAGVSISA
jgi:hypothetical protein